jgi:hypothetical protein
LAVAVLPGCQPPARGEARTPRSQFAKAAPGEAKAASDCNLEQLDGMDLGATPVAIPRSDGSLVAKGWLFSRQSQGVPAQRWLRLVGDESWDAPILQNLPRPDVPAYFRVGDWAAPSGFQQWSGLREVPAGRYHLLLAYRENGQLFLCDNGRVVEILAD